MIVRRILNRGIRALTPFWMWTRTCYGCSSVEPHSGHLTWIGRLHFATFKSEA